MAPHLSRHEADAGAGLYDASRRSARIRDLPVMLRPREEAARVGIEHVADDVLLALVLRGGVRGRNVVDVARALLQQYGSLRLLAAAPEAELASGRGLGPVKAQVLKAALELAFRLNREIAPRRQAVRSPADVVRLFPASARDTETVWVLMLDQKNRLRGRPVEVSRGLLDASLVHAREVFREAIRSAAARVLLVHNHPSGDPTPSAEDLRITREMLNAGRVLDIELLDHVILGEPGPDGLVRFTSLRESGAVDFSSGRTEGLRAASPSQTEGRT